MIADRGRTVNPFESRTVLHILALPFLCLSFIILFSVRGCATSGCVSQAAAALPTGGMGRRTAGEQSRPRLLVSFVIHPDLSSALHAMSAPIQQTGRATLFFALLLAAARCPRTGNQSHGRKQAGSPNATARTSLTPPPPSPLPHLAVLAAPDAAAPAPAPSALPPCMENPDGIGGHAALVHRTLSDSAFPLCMACALVAAINPSCRARLPLPPSRGRRWQRGRLQELYHRRQQPLRSLLGLLHAHL